MTKTEIREALTAAGLKAATISSGKVRFLVRMETAAEGIQAAQAIRGATVEQSDPRFISIPR